jgi:hypothetical protein
MRRPFIPGVSRPKWSDQMPHAAVKIAANKLRIKAEQDILALEDVAARLDRIERAQREREEAARVARREQAARLRPPR